MFRRSSAALILQGITFGKNKTDFFTSLWNKPETRDERVKEYVPEVLEESLEAQRAVREESTSRDVIVELGHKVLTAIENKSPTPSIAPHFNKLLAEYGAKDLITQRPLSYLLYPASAVSGGEQPHELILNFSDNFRTMVEEVEQNGCSIREAGKREKTEEKTEEKAPEAASADADVVMTKKEDHENMDVTMFIKVASAMSLANLRCGDIRNAVRCVDAGIAHAVDQQRLGGLLGLKAGLLVQQKKYKEAAEAAQLAVEASGNIQGYLHGAYSLRMLGRADEAMALLEKGREDHPMDQSIVAQLEVGEKLALAASSKGGKAAATAAPEQLTE